MCIVIIRCTLALISVGWSNILGTLTPKHVHLGLLPAVFFQFYPEESWGMDVQTTRAISRTVEDVN